MLTNTLFTKKTNPNRVFGVLIASIAGVMLISSAALAQSSQPAPATAQIDQPAVSMEVNGEPKELQQLPMSVTGVPESTVSDADINTIGDVESLTPNTFFSRFTTRRLDTARFRGIGSSPMNPGIMTYIDGVPQLNASSAGIQLMDIDQMEFIRGPQTGLFGRNSLGGLISTTSRRPSTTEWKGSVIAPLSSYSGFGGRLSASGPLTDSLSLGLTFGQEQRHGFTVNDVTGHDLDFRKAMYGKAHFMWAPGNEWEAHLILSGERDRDGDNALTDLSVLRVTPFHVSRDFEGFSQRDIVSGTLLTRHQGTYNFETITGFVHWRGNDATDIDVSARPRFTRDDVQKDLQLSQEIRLGSGSSSFQLADNVRLKWQTGLFVYAQNYDQDTGTIFQPFLFSPSVSAITTEHLPLSNLDDRGVGVYGQTTATFGEDFDVTFGMRLDRDDKKANIQTTFDPVGVGIPKTFTGKQSFTHKSPQFAVSYKFEDGKMIYGSFGQGYKAGGFNGAAPIGNEAYAEEQAWHFETGLKMVAVDGKLTANTSVFYIDWSAMQFDQVNPNTWAQFYTSNVGPARAEGVEFDLNARPHQKVDIFGAVGLTRARFGDGSTTTDTNNNNGLDGKIIPNTPGLTMSGGAQLSQPVSSGVTLYGRGEIWLNSGFEYNETNTQRQTQFSLVNYRIGLKHQRMFGEAWVKNALDTRYIPVAFAYQNALAGSGFVGEVGAPRTYGIRIGYNF
jgi:iron complex outermembrane recepter protein